MKVAYQGLPGAFSHQACLTFLPEHEPLPQPSFAAVADAVAAGRTKRGILPLANRTAGPVPGMRQLLRTSPIRQIERHRLAVRMHLLGLPDACLDEISVVVSHPMALAQCRQMLARLGLRGEEASNTAVAASELQDTSKAVLASAAAADAYGLQILLHDVHDDPNNATLFAVIANIRDQE